MANTRFSWLNFIVRLIAALVLVFATYNPEGQSYFHWAIEPLPEAFSVLKLFVGIILLVGWTVFLRATFRSLGVLGTVLAAAFFGTLLWLVVDFGLVDASSVRATSYLILLGLSCVLAAGLSWSHVRRRLSGQVDVDETDT